MKPKTRPDDDLAERVPRRDLLPRPAEIAHEEVVEERQAVERAADDREEREERRRDGERLIRARVSGASATVTPVSMRAAASFTSARRTASGCRGVEAVERVTAGDEPDARPGRAVAERAADRLAPERRSLEDVGRQIRIREHHAPEPDEIGQAVPHVVLRHVRQPFLQVAVRGADDSERREFRLQGGRGAICRETPRRGSSGGVVAIDRRKHRRPLNVRVVVRAARGNADQCTPSESSRRRSARASSRQEFMHRSSHAAGRTRSCTDAGATSGTPFPSLVFPVRHRVEHRGAHRQAERRRLGADALDHGPQEPRAVFERTRRSGPGRACALSSSWPR